jgi:hypothetical protein
MIYRLAAQFIVIDYWRSLWLITDESNPFNNENNIKP